MVCVCVCVFCRIDRDGGGVAWPIFNEMEKESRLSLRTWFGEDGLHMFVCVFLD
ncbi:hypothetical protein HanPSC8_Chr05g0202691 [Helianthus annuus]|nr:hypothetical protein HanPSC8_Chr05g0202691 [Helianthus annuus]